MIDYEEMIVIHEDLFQFDKSRENLTEYNRPENKCAIKDLQQREEIVWGFYHSPTSKIYNGHDYAQHYVLYEDLKHFHIPIAILRRGNELSEEVLMTYNQKSIENRDGFQYVTAKLSARLNGAPAEMTIDGIGYVVDLKDLEIRQKNHPEIKFIFPQKALDSPTELYYDTKIKRPVDLPDDITEYPEHVICFMFPKLNSIDPIGYCRLNGYPLTWLVCTCNWDPKNMNVPWKGLDRTDIPELVRRNQIKKAMALKRQNQDSNVQKISPRVNRKKS